MILSCRSCAARYLVDPHAIGAAGRKVRCAKCGHVWHQEPSHGSTESLAARPSEPRAIPDGSNLPSVRRASPGGRNLLGWATLLLFVTGTIAIGLLARQQAIAAWPPVERFYALVGLAPEIAGTGLEIRSVASGRMSEGEKQWLVVTGEILNTSQHVREVPELSGTLQDAEGKTVYEWFFVATETRLLPGEIVAFETRVENPSSTAEAMAIGFSGRD